MNTPSSLFSISSDKDDQGNKAINEGSRENNKKFTADAAVDVDVSDEPQQKIAWEKQNFENSRVVEFNPILKCHYLFLNEYSEHHPYNYKKFKSYYTVALYALMALGSQMSTSMFGQSASLIQKEYNVPNEISVLPTTLYMAGVALGPLIFAPLSERLGRKWGVVAPYITSAGLTISSYWIRNLKFILAVRLITGLFASPPIISSGGALKDLFRPEKRADMLLMYAVLVASGPAVGPAVGGGITQLTGHYRYIYLIIGGYMALLSILCVVFINETFLPVVEEKCCNVMRKEYPHLKFYSQHACQGRRLKFYKYLVCPYLLLFTHLTGWLSSYACFAFGTMYMVVCNMPTIVTKLFHRSHGQSTVFNITQFLGIMVGVGTNYYFNQKYKKHVIQVVNTGIEWKPEIRLGNQVLGGILLPFTFAFLRLGVYHPSLMAFGNVFLGCGFFSIFQSSLNYIIDVHGNDSASAVSAITLLRSLAAGALPLGASSMVQRLGYENFCYVMLGVACVGSLCPIYIYKTWANNREKNPYAVKAPS